MPLVEVADEVEDAEVIALNGLRGGWTTKHPYKEEEEEEEEKEDL